MATLKVLNGTTAGHSYEVASDAAVVGRYPFCDIVLPSHSISRQHARIVREADGYYIEDLNSLNGTFVNGKRVGGRTKLSDQDHIHVYETLLSFHDGSNLHAAPTHPGGPAPAAATVANEQGSSVRKTLIVGALDALGDARLEVAAEAKLRAVLQINRHLGRSTAIDEFLPRILDSMFDIFPHSDRGYILLADRAGGTLSLRAAKQRRGETGTSMTLGPISRGVAQRVMEAGEAILSTHSGANTDALSDDDIRSQMSVPLIGPSGSPLGIIHVESGDPDRSFTESDLDVLVSVAAVAGQAVEHARTYEASLRLDRRERELATAREVQLHFLPQHAPAIPHYSFFEYYKAADDVGGDYYGYIPCADGRLAIALGDVSGKGVSAALLMARLCSDVRFCVATSSSPEEALQRLNRELANPMLDDRFVTFLLVVLDPQRNLLTVVNAGHMPPLLRNKDNGVRELAADESGPPLGFDENSSYTAVTVPLDPGDTVVMYTDGIREATNRQGEIFGTRSVSETVAAAPLAPPAMGAVLLEAVDRFVNETPQSDDICLVCFGREQ